jgi:hypothetical protein
MDSWLIWGKNIIIALLSVFFLLFGVKSLMIAYTLKNPHEFIMYFFSSSLIILVSIVGIIYPAFRMKSILKLNKTDNDVQ